MTGAFKEKALMVSGTRSVRDTGYGEMYIGGSAMMHSVYGQIFAGQMSSLFGELVCCNGLLRIKWPECEARGG